MWQDFTGDTFVIGMKLWVAAADDTELHTGLQPIMHALDGGLLRLYTEFIGPDLVRISGAPLRMSMIRELLLGHAFARAFEPRYVPLPPPNGPKIRAELEKLVFDTAD